MDMDEGFAMVRAIERANQLNCPVMFYYAAGSWPNLNKYLYLRAFHFENGEENPTNESEIYATVAAEYLALRADIDVLAPVSILPRDYFA